MRRIGAIGICRTRSGPPAGAIGLIRGAADSASPSVALSSAFVAIAGTVAKAQPTVPADPEPAPNAPSVIDAYLNAFALLDRHEIVGMAITLSVICFAVVAAIMLVRTRERLAVTEANARDEIIASRAEVDRVYALLRAEPQILVAWAAGDDKPEIIGDVALVADADAPHRVLAFGLWLEPEAAQGDRRRGRSACASAARNSR